MDIVVTKQIGIQADSIEEGIQKVANGEGSTISVSANARPIPGQMQVMRPTPPAAPSNP